MSVIEDATITSKGQITIPKRIRDRLKLEEGTEVEFVFDDNGGLEFRQKESAMVRIRDVQRTLSSHDVDLEELRRDPRDPAVGNRSGRRPWRSARVAFRSVNLSAEIVRPRLEGRVSHDVHLPPLGRLRRHCRRDDGTPPAPPREDS
ncbi:AbrB/MazE/SpoVT family DNA-binding domain-containing protein [Natrinema saccharevitans]|uniref:AbrB/MazE/SpoVT family DNA-binding domain-containing protein n=1 Tax=Natrinema saccharevitans TaxID=301967 RepID=UPI00096C5EA8|nr:AbrB/MazE/SpoVT family DNA-binding domain-containing protein [Natrinema saccharevitans]